MKRYCPKCGAGTEYAVIKPTVCGGCKTSYDGTISVPTAQAQRPFRPTARREEPAYEDDEPTDDAPRETNFDPSADLRGLGVSINLPPNARTRVTLGQLGLQKKLGEPVRDIPRQVDTQNMIEEMLPLRHIQGGSVEGVKAHAVSVDVPVRPKAVAKPKPKAAPKKAVRKRK